MSRFHAFGDRERFAIEIEPATHHPATEGLRTVDIWAGGVRLTCDDNHAFLPSFCLEVERTFVNLLSEDDGDRPLPLPESSPEENHRFLLKAEYDERRRYDFLFAWGPTTQSVQTHLFRTDGSLLLTFDFWEPEGSRVHSLSDREQPGRIVVARFQERWLMLCLYQAMETLRHGR